MTSSRFSQRPAPQNKPAVCKKVPPSPIVGEPTPGVCPVMMVGIMHCLIQANSAPGFAPVNINGPVDVQIVTGSFAQEQWTNAEGTQITVQISYGTGNCTAFISIIGQRFPDPPYAATSTYNIPEGGMWYIPEFPLISSSDQGTPMFGASL